MERTRTPQGSKALGAKARCSDQRSGAEKVLWLWTVCCCALLLTSGCRSFYSPNTPPAGSAPTSAPVFTAPGPAAIPGTTVPTPTPSFTSPGAAADPLAPSLADTPAEAGPLPPAGTDSTAPSLPAVPDATGPAVAAPPSLAETGPPVFDIGQGAAVSGLPATGPVVAGPPVIGPPVAAGPAFAAPVIASRAALTLTPSQMVAPVGSEVILLAGVTGANGQPSCNQRVEWMLSPESAGQLLAVGDRGNWLAWRHLRDTPRKVSSKYVISSTSSSPMVLNRGTPTPIDDVQVCFGQAWVTLSSPTGGTSHVTAFAPDVPNWGGRQRTATIHWVDGQFSFPAPSIAPVGTRQTLSTTVTRSSDGTPIEGWLVRYEITSSDGAAFAPNGDRAIEVPTDASGTASIELYQQEAGRSTTQVDMQVIRPQVPSQAGSRRLAIGRGTTTVTWTASEAAMRVTGPQSAETGATATFRIEVSNPGSLPIDGVRVVGRLPQNMSYLRSSAAATQTAGGLDWQLGQLAPGAVSTIDVDFRCDQMGAAEFCAEVTAAGGPAAQQCSTVQIGQPPAPASLQVEVTGPETARVGDEITYDIKITNIGSTDVFDLELSDVFDVGLESIDAGPGKQTITGRPGGLSAGEVNDDLKVTFRVTKAGTLCHTVTVRAETGATAEAKKCVTVSETAAVPEVESAGLSVETIGPQMRQVGEKARFQSTITNTGNVVLTDLKIEATFVQGLNDGAATPGFVREGSQIHWTLDRLDVGQSILREVEAVCREVNDNACLNITVRANPNRIVGDAACIRIEAAAPLAEDPPVVPAESGLVVQIDDFKDQVAVGTDVPYEVRIKNPGTVSDRKVSVVIRVPAGFTAVEVPANSELRGTIAGNEIRFEPIQELRAGEEFDSIRFVLRAAQAGENQIVEAFVSSERETTSIVAQTETSVYGN